MKKIIFCILFVFVAQCTFAQTDSFKTNIETAANTKDFLIKQDIFILEDFGKFRIGAVKITNLENFTTTSGAKVIHIIQEGKTFKSYYNYIDKEEMDGLITALQYMKTMVKSKAVPSNYTEIKFTTKSGFLIQLSTVLNSANNLDWSFSVQTNVAVEKSYIVYQTTDIDKLQKILEQLKAKM
ncbi:MAG: hypothetical protein U0U67_04320 [Chitinophagales bacterium]